MRRAEEMTLSADLFVAIGSSLVVWPAAGFPLMAKRNGARLVIINRDPTEFDDIADLVVRHDIGAVLEPFIARLLENPQCTSIAAALCTVSHSLSRIRAISPLRATAAMLCLNSGDS